MPFTNLPYIYLRIVGRPECAYYKEEHCFARNKIGKEKKENFKLKSFVKSLKEKVQSKNEKNMFLSE